MKLIVIPGILALWLYVLHLLRRAALNAWWFLAGSLGLFLMLMFWVQPVAMMPLARLVCTLAGFVGDAAGAYSAYFQYGILFIRAPQGSMTLQIDMECSGFIEISAFLSLLAFFNVYSRAEKVWVGILGTVYLIVCNAVRITVICLSVHFFGAAAYAVVHTFIGRLLFYALSVLLYYYVFTKPQILRMKVGIITYEHSSDKNS